MREIGFGGLLSRYIRKRYYKRPIIFGLAVGILAGFLLGYYLIEAIEPGILGTLALIFLSLVFGVVAAAVTALVFFYLQIYRMTKLFVAQTCPNCGNQLPKDAAFCPYCGNSIE